MLIFFLIFGLVGCRTTAPLTPDYFANKYEESLPDLRKVGLVTSLKPPKIDGVYLGLTKGEGAAAGAAGGALEGAGAVFSGGGGGLAILLLPVFMVIGAVVGGVSGADSGYSAEMLAEAEANALRVLNSAYLQTDILERAQEYGHNNLDLEFIRVPDADQPTLDDKPDYKILSDQSIDAVLEVELIRIALKHRLHIDARARLVSTGTAEILSDVQYRYKSERRQLEQWIVNGGAPLTDVAQRGLQSLAEDMIDENFLLFYPIEPGKEIPIDPFEDPAAPKFAPVPQYVLSPLYPELKFLREGFANPFPSIWPSSVKINSLTPTFRWEAFPREHDVFGDKDIQQKLSDVNYDLRIFAAVNSESGPMIYSARNIQNPYHKIEKDLKACSHYYWTVRARFKLNGRPRAIEWAGAFDFFPGSEYKPWNLRHGLDEYHMHEDPNRMELFYFPFKTPCDSK